MPLPKSLLLLALLTLASCYTTHVVRLDEHEPGELPIYMSGTAMPEYAPVALISITAGILQTESQMLHRLRRQAEIEPGVTGVYNVKFHYSENRRIVEGIAGKAIKKTTSAPPPPPGQ